MKKPDWSSCDVKTTRYDDVGGPTLVPCMNIVEYQVIGLDVVGETFLCETHYQDFLPRIEYRRLKVDKFK